MANGEASAGLKKWAARRKTKTIAGHLEGKGVDDPEALAVWIRKQALGEEEFARHQASSKRKRGR